MTHQSERDPLIGTVVHNYVVRQKLAEGGMGAVYLAEHQDPRSSSKKVIKILLPEFSRHPIIRERFEHEALAVMRLKHPYIVEIDNFGTLPDGQLYLSMEFLDGETLEAHLLRRGRCNLHHTLHITAQIMSALQSLHEAALVHRDLKPANVFIVQTEQNPYEVRLIDLGIARNLAEPEKQKKTRTGIAMGTPGYMAVEQYESAASATPAADVYAVAVIVWRMLMGQLPWGEVYDERVLYFRQRTEDFEAPPNHEVSPEVVALLRKALAKEPTERPSVTDFINLLASYTPAVPPFVPSGAMILADVARRFIKQASATDETVRNVSHASIGTPMSWPHRGTMVPPSGHEPVAARSAPPTPAMGAPWGSPAIEVHAPRSTTLGASSGVLGPPPPRTRRPRSHLLAGVGMCVVAALVVFAVMHLRGKATSGAAPKDIGAASSPALAAPDAAPSNEGTAAAEGPTATAPSAVALPQPAGAASAPSAPPASSSVSAPSSTSAPSKSSPPAKVTASPPTRQTPATRVPKRSTSTATTASKRTDSKSAATAPDKKPAPSGDSERFDPNAIVE